jgi:hypothetical protein
MNWQDGAFVLLLLFLGFNPNPPSNISKSNKQVAIFPCPNDTYVETTIASLTSSYQPPSLVLPDGALPMNHSWIATMVQEMKVQDYGTTTWYQGQISTTELQCFYCVYGCNDVLLLTFNPGLSSPITCAKFSGKPSTSYGSLCSSSNNAISECLFEISCF